MEVTVLIIGGGQKKTNLACKKMTKSQAGVKRSCFFSPQEVDLKDSSSIQPILQVYKCPHRTANVKPGSAAMFNEPIT